MLDKNVFDESIRIIYEALVPGKKTALVALAVL